MPPKRGLQWWHWLLIAGGGIIAVTCVLCGSLYTLGVIVASNAPTPSYSDTPPSAFPSPTAFEKRYTSALLVNSLPASDFLDVNGQAVTPGTFYMNYSATYNGSPVMLVGSCTLSTDEHDAQLL
jgi:hypothetical protein